MDTTVPATDVQRVLPRDEWVKTLPQTIVASCVLLLDAEDRILLLRYAEGEPGAGLWGLPGGMLDHGEDPFGAACRELHEETGIVLDRAPRFIGYDHRADVKGTGPVIDFYFHGGRVAPGQTVRRSGEHDRDGLFALADLESLSLSTPLPALTALHTAALTGTVVCLREGLPR
ncbi:MULTISPECIES: NUDIX hydrolase [Streptomyces]|uniref:Bifunctional nicotinamide mononucleotide adenylyltransferase/ADP-ribose pyrophosphatase n=1 Tax=Streptomyces chartreusis NRRL 3882 TaxID=1079985 RepID=A0A2N9BF64_STRCX|nr:NUDIX hydrolase [Streptomyces chartreusis]MYS95401.1 NUDIX domain-containing protein [Streptomyces sp. SID5464]SOR82003.1 bifunctional nicotinamide mononucleotide adenylyltransferase/ADP-ribose pyrophosphatase [Streptomyces chartreusis NRRL 3882]